MTLAYLDDDVRAVLSAERLCFAATVTPDGRPNLSPKGTIRVWDDYHVFFCDIASPGTRRNLEANPWIELNVVDVLSRRGYRLLGRATLHAADAVFTEATNRVFGDEGTRSDVFTVVLVAVDRVLPLISPGYDHVSDEWAMRALWQQRRHELDDDFEAHIRSHGPLRPNDAVP